MARNEFHGMQQLGPDLRLIARVADGPISRHEPPLPFYARRNHASSSAVMHPAALVCAIAWLALRAAAPAFPVRGQARLPQLPSMSPRSPRHRQTVQKCRQAAGSRYALGFHAPLSGSRKRFTAVGWVFVQPGRRRWTRSTTRSMPTSSAPHQAALAWRRPRGAGCGCVYCWTTSTARGATPWSWAWRSCRTSRCACSTPRGGPARASALGGCGGRSAGFPARSSACTASCSLPTT